MFFVTALFIQLSQSKPRAIPCFYRPVSRSAIFLPFGLSVTIREAKPEYDSVDFREVTKHARGVSRSHTSRRDIFGDDAACPDYSAAANADAGEDDYL